MTSSVIEPATIWFVPKCLNHLRYHVLIMNENMRNETFAVYSTVQLHNSLQTTMDNQIVSPTEFEMAKIN
jgi:hypothetical protein